MREIGIGIIGCGDIAGLHAQALLRTGQARIVALYDRVLEKAQSLAKTYGGQPYPDMASLLADRLVEAVYVLTHHDSHATICLNCLRAGKHVFCEKPLAMCLSDAIHIGQVVKSTDRLLMVGFNHRWNPAIAWLHDHINKCKTPIRYLQLTFVTSPFLDSWGGLAGEGGGVLPCLGSHAIDLACYLMGLTPVRVQAMTARLRLADPYLEDTTAILLQFVNGEIASISSHDHAPTDYTSYATGNPSRLVRAEIFADGWAACIEDSHCVDIFGGQPNTIQFSTEDPLDVLGIGQEDDAFIHALVNGKPVSPGVKEGIQAVQWVELAMEASRLEKSMSLKVVHMPFVKSEKGGKS